MGDCGTNARHGAVDRLRRKIEVHAIGAIEHGTGNGCGCGAGRGGGGHRRSGDGDAARHVPDPGRYQGNPAHLSLKATFIGQTRTSQNASKRAVRLWLQ